MKIVCFPHGYYLSEVSRLVEIGKKLRDMGQEVIFFSHGGPYHWVAESEGFNVVTIQPTMSPERANTYMKFNRAEVGNPFRDSFFTYEELKDYVPREAEALKETKADAVLIGWNLPSYLSTQLVGIPIIVQQPGPFTAPFFDRKMGEFVPSFIGLLRHLPMDWFINWFIPRMKVWLKPFNQLATELGLPNYKTTLDFMAGDLTLVMDTPEILKITHEELLNYTPRHPAYFNKPPLYRYGGPCFAKLPGGIPENVKKHFDTKRTKLFCGMGVSGSPKVLGSIIDIVGRLDLQAVVVTTTILQSDLKNVSDRVLVLPHVPTHLVNPMADIAITHGGAGTVQTAIHSGTPLIGVPMHAEQVGNVSLVRRQGAGILLPKQSLAQGEIENSIKKLITNKSYKENMMRLKKLQDQIDGPSKAAEEIIKFIQGRSKALN
ncbi:hypothetical protein BVX98_05370 [bacterium F11]|nr:hypothetical protein BVX98_05370 [bacterium F11]